MASTYEAKEGGRQSIFDANLFDVALALLPDQKVVRRRTLFRCPSAWVEGSPAFLVFGGAVALNLAGDTASNLVADGLGRYVAIGHSVAGDWVAVDPKTIAVEQFRAALVAAVTNAGGAAR